MITTDKEQRIVIAEWTPGKISSGAEVAKVTVEEKVKSEDRETR